MPLASVLAEPAGAPSIVNATVFPESGAALLASIRRPESSAKPNVADVAPAYVSAVGRRRTAKVASADADVKNLHLAFVRA